MDAGNGIPKIEERNKKHGAIQPVDCRVKVFRDMKGKKRK
jgi:hypothetical protein